MKLKNYRTDRPDEWAMDHFIRDAVALENKTGDMMTNDTVLDREVIPNAEAIWILKEMISDCDEHIAYRLSIEDMTNVGTVSGFAIKLQKVLDLIS